MVNVSDIFSLCGTEGVPDVSTSLARQDIMGEISVPIFEGVYLKIIPNGDLGFLCSTLQEVGVIQYLGRACGTVGIALNILDLDILTVLGCICTFTPRTGANIFFKNNIPDITQLAEDITGDLAALVGLPFDPVLGGGKGYLLDIANKAIDILFNRLIETLEDDLGSKGIGIHKWNEIPIFKQELVQTGELLWMNRIRRGYNLPII